MNPEHCVSLEIAKQLKLAGWEKKTEFWWVSQWIKSEHRKDEYGEWHITQYKPCNLDIFYPAPLATDILEELPQEKEIKLFTSSLPDALALMWLSLRKEGLL